MRRIFMFLFTVAVITLGPTAAHAGTSTLDPNGGQSLKALTPWLDSLVSVLLTYLGT